MGDQSTSQTVRIIVPKQRKIKKTEGDEERFEHNFSWKILERHWLSWSVPIIAMCQKLNKNFGPFREILPVFKALCRAGGY